MNRIPLVGYLILILGSCFFPYAIISIISWDINIGNWNIWVRALFVIWSLAITSAVLNKLRNE